MSIVRRKGSQVRTKELSPAPHIIDARTLTGDEEEIPFRPAYELLTTCGGPLTAEEASAVAAALLLLVPSGEEQTLSNWKMNSFLQSISQRM